MAKAEKPLILDGRPFELNPVKPVYVRIAQWLDEHCQDEFLSPRELAQRSGIGFDSIFHFSQDEKFKAYVVRHGAKRKIYYGSPRLIDRVRATIAKGGK